MTTRKVDTCFMINVSFGKNASARVSGINNKVKASMRAVLDENWLETNEDNLFRAAVGGVLVDVGVSSDDGQRIARTMEALNKVVAMLIAAQAGVKVDAASALPDEIEQFLPLKQWWLEVKDDRQRAAV